MVTKIVKLYMKRTLTILISFMLVKCAAINNHSINNDILLFENYYQCNIILPIDLKLSDKTIYCIDSVIINKEKILQSQKDQITGELNDILCNLDLINQWYAFKQSDINPYSEKYEDFVKKRKQELELYYLGKLKLSSNFNSYLILVSNRKNDEYNNIKTVFLINVADQKLASITRMSSYTYFEGECNYIYTKVSVKGVFMQKEKKVSSDVILPKDVLPEKEKTGKNFVYDKKGLLKILHH